jgi:hypothetical protein
MFWHSFSAAVLISLALADCVGPDFPTAEQSLCTAGGIGCRPECEATLMPSPSAAVDAPTYHLGPHTCATVAFDDAARKAGRLCRERGFELATDAPAVTEEAAVPPLPPADIATFRCERRG